MAPFSLFGKHATLSNQCASLLFVLSPFPFILRIFFFFFNSYGIFPTSSSSLTAVDKLRGFRAKNRVPLVEALYNGHVRPLEVYLRKKLPLFAAARSTVAPLAVCPFVTPPPGRAKEVKRKLELARNRYVGNTDKPTESNDDEHQDSSEVSGLV